MTDDVTEAGWAGDLSEALGRIAQVATGRGEMRVLRGGRRFALGLPQHPDAARVVVDFYHPHRLNGRVFRLVAMLMVKLRLYRRMLSPQAGVEESPAVAWLRPFADEGRVGFVGCNPSHGLRCIVGGIGDGSDATPFIGKLGFDRSRDAIVREAEVLGRLGGCRPGVLEALSFETGEDWAFLRLPHLGFRSPRNLEDPAVVELLLGWLGRDKTPLGEIAWGAELLQKAAEGGVDSSWCDTMRTREVQTALGHGDFAVWNLRLQPTGLCAFDWEWAVEDGVSGIDLAYGLRQEALLVRRLNPEQAVQRILAQARKRPLETYLEACGWHTAHEDWLRLGLIYSHFSAHLDSREMLAVLGLGDLRGS